MNLLLRIINPAISFLIRQKKQFFPNWELEKIPFYLTVKNHLLGSIRQSEVTVNGYRLILDPLDSLEISLYGNYEPFETQLIKSEIKPGMKIVDLGANIGYYTLLFSLRTGETGHVHAFEPARENFGILSKNLRINDCRNVTAYNQAAASKTGTALLYLSEENLGDHRLVASTEQRTTLAILKSRVDEVVPPPVDLIKMDIQGFEYEALAGMGTLIQASPKVTLFSEFWPEGLLRSGSTARQFLDLLHEYEFAIYHINEYSSRIDPADETALLRTYTVENGRHSNLLCRKGF